MFYNFVKVIARIALRFYCRNLQLNNPAVLNSDGPLLLAANHPNSFLDAIILCTLFNRPVYSLARGDAFKGKLLSRLLIALKLLPVYRVSEGVENLEENYKTFDACKEIFKKNGIVLIFSEGRCVNEWHLRPLKKGTARLVLSCWEDGIPLKVLPVGINYSSFTRFGKNILLSFGSMITEGHLTGGKGYGRSIQEFNGMLRSELQPLVVETSPGDQDFETIFYKPVSFSKKMMLVIPALVGWLLHAPLYKPVKTMVRRMLNSSDHFDSLMVSILFLLYPLYVALLTLVSFLITEHWSSLLLLALVPFTGWAHIQLKKQLDISVDTAPAGSDETQSMITQVKTGERAL